MTQQTRLSSLGGVSLVLPGYSSALFIFSMIGTLVVAGLAVTFGTARSGLGGAAARPGPSSLYQI